MVKMVTLDEDVAVGGWQAPPALDIPMLLRTERARSIPIVKAIGHTVATDDSDAGAPSGELSDFNGWEDVVSTLWNKSLQLTGWDPSSTDFDSASFASFKTKFSTCPYWNGIDFNISHRDATLQITDYRQAVNAIVDLLVHVKDPGRVLENVRQIAQLATTNVDTQQRQTVMQNGTISTFEGKVYASVLYGIISVTAHRQKFKVSANQTVRIVRAYGQLDVGFCKRNAERILSYDGKLALDWEGEAAANSSDENESPGW